MTSLDLEVMEQAYFEPTHVGDMAKRLGAEQASVERSVRLLRQMHLVTRDARTRIIRITPSGKVWVESGRTR